MSNESVRDAHPEYYAQPKSAKTHEQVVESRLTVIAWSTSVVAVATIISAIGGIILASHL